VRGGGGEVNGGKKGSGGKCRIVIVDFSVSFPGFVWLCFVRYTLVAEAR